VYKWDILNTIAIMKTDISTFSDKKIALICDWIGDW
jgi:hypothetical protein